MKKFLVFGLILCVIAISAVAMAAVSNTSHDIEYYSIATGDGACSYCHVPHGAAGARLFPATTDSTGIPGAITWRDPTSMMCYNCHVTLSGTYPQAENVNPFSTGKHPFLTSALNGIDLTGTDYDNLDANVYGVSGSGGTQRISCASCHNPHSQTYRPFLRVNTDVGTGVALIEGELGTLCDDCHEQRFLPLVRTNHPVDIAATTSARATILAFASIDGALDNTWADLTADSAKIGGANQTNAHWNLGGKFITTDGGATVTTNFDCATCHAVHSNETLDFTADDGITVPSGSIPFPGNNLAVMSVDPSGATIAAICTGCHDVDTAYPSRGPGLINTYSHPVNQAYTMPINVTVAVANGAKNIGDGATGDIVCQGCHDMHFSSPAIAAVSTTYAMLRAECNDCHDSTSTLGNHHPTGPVAGGTDYRSGAVVNTSIDWQTESETGITTIAYDFPGNALTCSTCHGGGNATAHNLPVATGGFPGLTGEIDESEMCVDCHSFNPSTFTGRATATGTGTHLTGDIDNVDYFWQNETVTPLAGDYSKRSPDTDADAYQSLICESCHTLKVDGKNLTAVTYQTSDNDSDASTDGGQIALLLTNSGNDREDATPTNDNLFLCTACHGDSPSSTGTGATHPTLHAAPGMTGVSGTVSAGVGANGLVSLTDSASPKINCESCHRPHNADTDSGTLILEYTGAGLDESDLCIRCHTDK